MAGYHDIVMPDVFSQGSAMEVSYDTRITTLENGIETRMSKYRPEGRRKYNVLRGIAKGEDVSALRNFFILRQGALNSFKFKDWMDYATTQTGTVFGDGSVQVSAFDGSLSLLFGRTYQMVKVYSDSARTITRVLTKVKPNSEEVAVHGNILTPSEYTINNETGEVTIVTTAFDPIGAGSVTAGCEFYVPVRFAESTDQAFSVAMQATDNTQSLPGFELIEDVSPLAVSQDYQFGGSQHHTGLTGAYGIVEVQGRLQSFAAIDANLVVRLPQTFSIPTGGPIFVIYNSGTFAFDIADTTGSSIMTLGVADTAQVFLANPFGFDSWVVV